MKKCTKVALWCVGGFFVLGGIASMSDESAKASGKKVAEVSTESQSPYVKYITPTARELLKLSIADDLRVSLNGNDTMLPMPNLIKVSANALSKAYTSNELRADDKYKDHWALITGRVSAVEKATLGGYQISMSEPMSLNQVVLNFDEDQKSNIVDYDKGERGSFVCRIDGGNTLGVTSASDCTTLSDWKNNQTIIIYNKIIDNINDGKFDNQAYQKVAGISAILGYLVDHSKDKICKNGISESCMPALENIFKTVPPTLNEEQKQQLKQIAIDFDLIKLKQISQKIGA